MASLLGNLFILAAPSGAGKSSLIKALMEKYGANAANPMQVSVSHTTRAPRPGEVNGQHYHFVDKTEFEALIEQGAFFEWAEVFGNYYGTSRITIEETLHKGIDVFLDIDWQGARQVKEVLPDTCGIFILPPSLDVLNERLNNRGQDSQEVIAGRMSKAVDEMIHYDEFDHLIINDDFDTALGELHGIVTAQRVRTIKQSMRHSSLIAELTKKP
ncbi:guanylate kinase [Alteromonas sp. KUL49]|uniref:guanylate kinase n=1 Tax=Alteromonas sp. KUL49 TaxID=2480798 RepID=UPI00102ED711|nr:guanylate kinase [Alteromonas sp. KUL49]TAP39362.1 guanylate kinase [Alteromonas sp. KUL49]GEA12155.1 guanylate kinase [Alteromonas sp. KUL49]